jgi:hypothetical protein
MDIPVLFIAFNRPDVTMKVFERIKAVSPKKLYFAVDGPRMDVLNDFELCNEVKSIVNLIDWDCEIKTLLRDTNIGCKSAVSNAINWFFDSEEFGIILEDDCVPDTTFFKFCEVLLDKYKNDDQILLISGTNFAELNPPISSSYYYTKYPRIWGWATWKRVWKEYDVTISNFEYQDFKKKFSNYFDTRNELFHWLRNFEKVKNGEIDTWDIQFSYLAFTTSRISISPTYNLISNIGFGKNATHTTNEKSFANIGTYPMKFPLISPLNKDINKLAESISNRKEGIQVTFMHYMLKELKRYFTKFKILQFFI